MVPFPLHVEHRGEGVTICMTKLEGAARGKIWQDGREEPPFPIFLWGELGFHVD
jgi:hypothetical protein